MSTSDSGVPPRSPRKLVLRKIAKEVSFSAALPAPHPPAVAAARPTGPPPRLATRPPPAFEEAIAEPIVSAASVERFSAARLVAPLSPLPAPPPGNIVTPMPSRISVPPFVASVPPAALSHVVPATRSQRTVLVACAVGLAGILVGVLLGTRLDAPADRATARGLPLAEPTRTPQSAVAEVEGQTTRQPAVVATANVNDLPRAPQPSLRRPVAAPPPARPPARKAPVVAAAPIPTTAESPPDTDDAPASATATKTIAPPAASAEATPAPSARLATTGEATPAQAGDVPPATSTAPAEPPPDPLILEIQKAIGDSQKKN